MIDEGARRALDQLAAGSEPQADDYESLRQALSRSVQRFPWLNTDDRLEVADEAIFRFTELATQHPERQPVRRAGYIYVIARNIALDRNRRHREFLAADPDAVEDMADGDDAIAALIDGHVSAEVVNKALALAAAEGEATCTKVVAAWLNLAGAENRRPSARAVATHVDLTHPTVSAAMRTFQVFLLRIEPSLEIQDQFEDQALDDESLSSDVPAHHPLNGTEVTVDLSERTILLPERPSEESSPEPGG